MVWRVFSYLIVFCSLAGLFILPFNSDHFAGDPNHLWHEFKENATEGFNSDKKLKDDYNNRSIGLSTLYNYYMHIVTYVLFNGVDFLIQLISLVLRLPSDLSEFSFTQWIRLFLFAVALITVTRFIIEGFLKLIYPKAKKLHLISYNSILYTLMINGCFMTSNIYEWNQQRKWGLLLQLAFLLHTAFEFLRVGRDVHAKLDATLDISLVVSCMVPFLFSFDQTMFYMGTLVLALIVTIVMVKRRVFSSRNAQAGYSNFDGVYRSELRHINNRRRFFGGQQHPIRMPRFSNNRLNNRHQQSSPLISNSSVYPSISSSSSSLYSLQQESDGNDDTDDLEGNDFHKNNNKNNNKNHVNKSNGGLDAILEQRDGLIGLGLSGGGIRSAIFNLGLLQSLGMSELLPFVDYMSTVSGGGYIGSALTSLLQNPKASVRKKEFPFRFESEPNEFGTYEERLEIRWLRENRKYLAPTSRWFFFEWFIIFATYLPGVVLVNLAPFGMLLLTTHLIAEGIHQQTFSSISAHNFYLAAGFFIVVLVLHALYAATVDKSVRKGENSRDLEGLLLFLAVWCIVIGASIQLISAHLSSIAPVERILRKSLWITITVVCISFAVPPTSQRLHAICMPILWISGAFSLIFVTFVLCLEAHRHLPFPPRLALTLLIASTQIDINAISMHNWYREQLCKVFIVNRGKKKKRSKGKFVRKAQKHLPKIFRRKKRNQNSSRSKPYTFPSVFNPSMNRYELPSDSDTEDEDNNINNQNNNNNNNNINNDKIPDSIFQNELPLSDICSSYNGPYQLINTTLNIPNTSISSLRGRESDLFLLSKYYCGSDCTGYLPTNQTNYGSMRLGTAMAISGAAASPLMGLFSHPLFRFLMSLLNLRLNYWVQHDRKRWFGNNRFWPYYFIQELFGICKETDSFLNLSDGGHYDNLGLYALVKRRCKYIVVSDAGCDPESAMDDLANAIQKIRIDFGVNIMINMKGLEQDKETNHTPLHYVTGRIKYPGSDDLGTIVYIKSSLTGREPIDILSYKMRNPAFPHEATANQFFTEEQFESYRKLGEIIGEEVFVRTVHAVMNEQEAEAEEEEEEEALNVPMEENPPTPKNSQQSSTSASPTTPTTTTPSNFVSDVLLDPQRQQQRSGSRSGDTTPDYYYHHHQQGQQQQGKEQTSQIRSSNGIGSGGQSSNESSEDGDRVFSTERQALGSIEGNKILVDPSYRQFSSPQSILDFDTKHKRSSRSSTNSLVSDFSQTAPSEDVPNTPRKRPTEPKHIPQLFAKVMQKLNQDYVKWLTKFNN